MAVHASATYRIPRGLVGQTPLLQLSSIHASNPSVSLYAKLEMCNISGSMKDRAAFNMIQGALNQGLVKPGGRIVESSSGNMAIGLARASLFFKLRFTCFVDERTNKQTVKLLKSLGATVKIVHSRDLHESESLLSLRLRRVAEFLKKHPDAYWTNQYANPDNAAAYGPMVQEIETSLSGQEIDYLFCATGTCGTIRGCTEYLRAAGKKTKVVAVDAVGSSIFGTPSKPRFIPGHGSSMQPSLFSEDMCDMVVHIDEKDAIRGCNRLLEQEGVLAGGSSGAIVSALESLLPNLSGNIVLILADGGERYLDSVYNQTWVKAHGLG